MRCFIEATLEHSFSPCKHVRSPNSLPAISDEVKGSHALPRQQGEEILGVHFTTRCNKRLQLRTRPSADQTKMEWLSKAGDLLDKVRERPEGAETRGCDVV